jgi:hypothetical protein
MSPYIPYLSVLLIAILCLVPLYDEWVLRWAHAKALAHYLNALRAVLGVPAVVVAVTHQSLPYLAAALLVLAVCLLAVPYSWIIRVSGGREPAWELRLAGWEAAVLRYSTRTKYPSTDGERGRMRGLMRRMEQARRPETSELCDLYLAECVDWLTGTYLPLARAWRAVRADEIERDLFGSPTAPVPLDPSEATFRWRLFRQLCWLADSGPEGMTTTQRRHFRALLDGLEQFRRPDTAGLLDLVRASAESWLARDSRHRPWTPRGHIEDLGPAVQAEQDKLWPSEAVFSGAQLDGEDAAYFSRPDVRADVLRVAEDGCSTQQE